MALRVKMICDPKEERVISFDSQTGISINLWRVARGDNPIRPEQFRRIRETCDAFAQATVGRLEFESSSFDVSRFITENISLPAVSSAFIDRLRICLAETTTSFKDVKVITHPDVWEPWVPCNRGIVRWGIVELRVLENFLEDPDALKSVVREICLSQPLDDAKAYSKGSPATFLSTDDVSWNLRRLMTNAGMYFSDDPSEAWECIRTWCNEYLSSLLSSKIASVPPGYPFFYKVQKYAADRHGAKLTYVRHPDAFDFYRFAGGKRVLVVSPFSSAIKQQASSGNLYRLFNDAEVPEFEVEAINAPISTFPNRPDGSWLDSFQGIRRQIDNVMSERPFDIFAASCGSYGLPLCNYVTQQHSKPVFYVGNILHAYFGILQRTSENFMHNRRNHAAWVRGDLSGFSNLGRIDDGRYL